ncbi:MULTISPECIES: formyltransferase family protein [Nocardia]|uniref:formyltransferase family protein n=1 Tax=Nocardia TaxID=1817 RepID=UPI000BF05570|nr:MULTISPECIES: formyltransferase family protein [Nocardia]MBF6187044.1 hypothetical protein [Nocardia farcinica]MBF6312691.1 hypothetical protein [Nocardia farcinica]MBF6408454.1 hypothetical protein [Nocardia farcinica]PEH78914.1 hypothetical protein CRM89_25500 [Nocardia sp. FDAARGOS_372]UEX23539.1 hypothetical protein LMJ57_03285 [Nocardia farcinica]
MLSALSVPGVPSLPPAPPVFDSAAIRRLEGAGIFHPSRDVLIPGPDPETIRRWSALLGSSRTREYVASDLRATNTALKLSEFLQSSSPQEHGTATRSPTAGDHLLADLLSERVNEIEETTRQWLRHAEPQPGRYIEARRGLRSRDSRLRIGVAGPSGSAGVQRLHDRLAQSGPVGLFEFTPAPASPADSRYAAAWYPAEDSEPAVRVSRADWSSADRGTSQALGEWITGQQLDLCVLSGMPLVPEAVVRAPRIGCVNAHNGALPRYRGMDAVGWALIEQNTTISCSAQIITTGVDIGTVIATAPMSVFPLQTLRRRVRQAQVQVITDAVDQAPNLDNALWKHRIEGGTLYFRLHHRLRTALDRAVRDSLTQRRGGDTS